MTKLFRMAFSPRRLAAVLFLFAFAFTVSAQRQMEKLGRGVVAIHNSAAQVYVSWRLLATDPDGTSFNVLRSANGAVPVQINSQLVTNTTDFLDTSATLTISNAWFIQPVVDRKSTRLNSSHRCIS